MNSVTIRILNLKMKVKFQSRVHVEFHGQPLTTQVSSSQYVYHFHQDAHIHTPVFKNILDLQVIITTDKGARYNAGSVRVTESQLQQTQQSPSYFLLDKCFDMEAKLELQLVKWRKNQGDSEISQDRFRNKLDFENRQNYPLSFERYRQSSRKDLTSESNTDSQFNQKINVADAMEISHIKSKLQRNKSTILERNRQIKQLSETIQEQQNMITAYEDELIEKKNELQWLEEKFGEYQKEFEAYIDVQNRKRSSREEEYQNNMRKFQDQYNLQLSQQKHFYEFQTQKLKDEVEQYKILIDNLTSSLKQERKQSEYNLFSSNDEVKILEGRIKKVTEANEQAIEVLQQKIGKLNFTIAKLEKDKETLSQRVDVLNSYQANSAELERNLKKKDDEISIFKKKVQRLQKYKQTQRINLEEKAKASFDALIKERDNLVGKCKTLIEAKDHLEKGQQQLKLENKRLRNQILQTEKKHSSIKYEEEEKKLQIKQAQKQYSKIQKQFLKAKEQQQSFQQTLDQKINKVEQCQIKIEQLSNTLDDKDKKISNLQHCVNRMKLELQSKSNSIHYSHQECRNIEEDLKKLIQKQKSQIDYQEVSLNQVRQTSRKQQQMIKQLESQKISHLNSISVLKKQLSESNSDFLRSESSLKEKQVQISSGMGERQSLVKEIAKLEKMFEQQKEKQWVDQQKIKKNEKSLELIQKQKQELKRVLNEKVQKLEKLQELDIEKTKQMSLLREENTQLQLKIKNLIAGNERQKKSNADMVREFCEMSFDDQQPCQILKKFYKRQKAKWIEEISHAKDEGQIFQQELSEKNKIIQDLVHEIQSLQSSLQAYGKDVEYLQQFLNTKQQQMENIQNQHSQLIQIHEQYIFSYNRYKIQKEEEFNTGKKQNAQQKQKIENLQNQIMQFQNQVNSKNKEIAKVERIIEDKAAQLKYTLNNKEKMDEDIKNLQKQIKYKEEQIKSTNTKFHDSSEEAYALQIMNNDFEKKVQELEQENKQNKQALLKIVMSKQEAIHENIELNKKISQFEMQSFAQKQQIEALTSENHSIKQELKQLSNHDRNIKNELNSLSRQIVFKTEAYQELEKKYHQLFHRYESQKMQSVENEAMYSTKLQKYLSLNENLQKEIIEGEEKLQNEKFQIEAEKLELQYKINELTQQLTSSKQINQANDEFMEEIVRLKKIISDIRERNTDLENEIYVMNINYKQLQEDNKEKEQQLYITTGKVNEMEQYLANDEKRSRRSIEYLKNETEEKIGKVILEYEKKINLINEQLTLAQEREKAYQVQITYKGEVINNLESQLNQLKGSQKEEAEQSYYKTKVQQLQSQKEQLQSEFEFINEERKAIEDIRNKLEVQLQRAKRKEHKLMIEFDSWIQKHKRQVNQRFTEARIDGIDELKNRILEGINGFSEQILS